MTGRFKAMTIPGAPANLASRLRVASWHGEPGGVADGINDGTHQASRLSWIASNGEQWAPRHDLSALCPRPQGEAATLGEPEVVMMAGPRTILSEVTGCPRHSHPSSHPTQVAGAVRATTRTREEEYVLRMS